jgi:hypothetical protein
MPTKEQIEQIIHELQKILRLSDWEFFYYHCSDAEMLKYTGSCDNLGHYSVNIKRNCADIYINYEAKENEKEWYDSVAHELIHVLTIGYRNRELEMLPFIEEKYRKDIDRDSTDYYEQMVDSLTRVFVKLYPVSNFESILNQIDRSPTSI